MGALEGLGTVGSSRSVVTRKWKMGKESLQPTGQKVKDLMEIKLSRRLLVSFSVNWQAGPHVEKPERFADHG